MNFYPQKIDDIMKTQPTIVFWNYYSELSYSDQQRKTQEY